MMQRCAEKGERDMKRVIVIGCPGSGKSTFARSLEEKTGLPLVHLDLLNWNADRTTVPREVFRARLRAAMAQETWIIDGNYGSTMEARLAVCDTVFFLDYPLAVCMDGILSRRGTVRPDMPWVEDPEDVDEEFLQFVRSYEEESRPVVLALLEKYSEKAITIFRSREEADAYLRSL